MMSAAVFDEDKLRDALRTCFTASHPLKRPLNVVDLGMVETISLAVDVEGPGAGIAGVLPRYSLRLELIPCSNDEDAMNMLIAQIRNGLAGVPQLSRIEIFFAGTPVWTASRIAPRVRALLGLEAPAFPILNNRVV